MKLPATLPLSATKPKICMTSSAILVHEGKVLLIKHKKLQMWLAPGGHVEPDEMLHQSAEREFWEETGVEVEAVNTGITTQGQHSNFVPSPISANLHWISESNYAHRTQEGVKDEDAKKNWSKGCEQHIVYVFLVKPKKFPIKYHQNVEETDGIKWFTLEEIKQEKDVHPDFLVELEHGFKVASNLNL